MSAITTVVIFPDPVTDSSFPGNISADKDCGHYDDKNYRTVKGASQAKLYSSNEEQLTKKI